MIGGVDHEGQKLNDGNDFFLLDFVIRGMAPGCTHFFFFMGARGIKPPRVKTKKTEKRKL